MGLAYAFVRRSDTHIGLDLDEMAMWELLGSQYSNSIERLYEFAVVLRDDGILDEDACIWIDKERNCVWVDDEFIVGCNGVTLELGQDMTQGHDMS
jgi:hypothetical protein